MLGPAQVAARLLEFLAARGEMTVGELVEVIKLSQSALSQHLARLRADGLVTFRRTSQTLGKIANWPADWYYPRGFLSVPDQKLQSFYWIQLYKIASGTRAGGPASIVVSGAVTSSIVHS